MVDLISLDPSPYLKGLERASIPHRPPILTKLIQRGLADEGSLRGFYKYVDLSVDILDFISDTDFPTGTRWFKECLSSWFDELRTHRVLDLLKIWGGNGDPAEPNDVWIRRKLAVTELI